jgi:protocatechuate 3,4-dioxygenase, beta subunit
MRRASRFSRRTLLEVTGAWGVAGALGAIAAAAELRRTPTQVLGPFYPLDKPLDTDADLTLIKGHERRAAGQVVHVMGRVLTATGKPVAGARIEIWQANSYGRYTHPSAGRYRFKTIKPASYPAVGGMRPPHVHFDVTGMYYRLVTQMYFPGESLNDDDSIIGTAASHRRLLIADVGPPTRDLEPDSLLARWDIVLETG